MARFGEIGKQYLDDSGDPLVSGKLYFYESGTTTNKDTYSDVNLAIVNTNPVILTASGRQPNIFFDGTARVVLTDADEVQIEVKDPEGGDTSTGQFDEWNSLIVYSQYDISQESGVAYQSLTNNNQGNTPSSSPSDWEVYAIDLINDTTPQLGGDLDCNGNQIVNDTYPQAADASLGTGTHTFDATATSEQQLTATGNITLAFTFTTGVVGAFIIDAVNFGAHTITLPAGMLFNAATAPTFTAAGRDKLLVTHDKDDILEMFVIGQEIA